MAQTRQSTAFSDPSDLVARRMGFIPLPLSVAIGRVLCTTLNPTARLSNFILFVLGYFILVAFRVLNSLLILGRACNLLTSDSVRNSMTRTKKTSTTSFDNNTNNLNNTSEQNNCGIAMFSNSANSLTNVCLNDSFVNNEKTQQSNDFSMKVRAESEPILPQ